MKLPVILECAAVECAYNSQQRCHAAAITVGDGARPRCDTYWKADDKGGVPGIQGEVGACRATLCRHNDRLECTVQQGIRVGPQGDVVNCLTFAAR